MSTSRGFFSISSEMIATGRDLPFRLYINSSSVPGRERFVGITREGERLTTEDIARFVDKYQRIYLRESDRSLFLKSLAGLTGVSDRARATVLKDSAIQHLHALFTQGLSTEVLARTVAECRDVVEGMVDVLSGYQNVNQLQGMIAELSFHDFYTYDHSINVGMYTILIFRLLHPQARREEVVEAGMGGLLHDMGKVRIPNEILNKSGKLTDQEFAEIRKHPGYGADLLHDQRGCLGQDLDFELLARVIFEHHENFDGTGYPRQMAGENIHSLSRIIAVADFFDAITTKRSYHEPLSVNDAIALMSKSRGKKLDPRIFGSFTNYVSGASLQRELRRELPSDFDPCQPHDVLPLIASVAESRAASGKGFGGISVVIEKKEDLEALSTQSGVKVIQAPLKPAPRPKASPTALTGTPQNVPARKKPAA